MFTGHSSSEHGSPIIFLPSSSTLSTRSGAFAPSLAQKFVSMQCTCENTVQNHVSVRSISVNERNGLFSGSPIFKEGAQTVPTWVPTFMCEVPPIKRREADVVNPIGFFHQTIRTVLKKRTPQTTASQKRFHIYQTPTPLPHLNTSLHNHYRTRPCCIHLFTYHESAYR